MDPLVCVTGDARQPRLLRRCLDRQIECGLHDEILGRLLAQQGADLAIEPVGEILGALAGERLADTRTGRRERRVALGGGDRAGRDRSIQHRRRALGGAVAVGGGIVARGTFHRGRQQGRLAERQLGCGLVEVALRGGLDAVSAAAEVHPIKIEREDLLLGELGLQPDRQDQLLGLPPDALGRCEEEIARQLLGDGRATLQGRPVVGQVVEFGPRHPPRIESEVVVELAVLDGDEGGRDVRRQLVDIDRRRFLGAADGD